ncbi:MAG: hypothetical protein MUE84_07300 [Hyphomonas sp.]|nr:hypothetical protein [Hyphomonas sp.]
MMRAVVHLAMGLLVVAAGILMARSALDVIDTSAIGSKSAAIRPATNSADVTVAAVAPLEALSDTRERPLFSTDRRRVPDSPAAQDEEAAPGLTLIGLMRPLAKEPRALFRIDGTGKAAWTSVGDVIGGAKLREIRAGAVVLERDGRSIELRLRPTRTASETP